MIKYTKDYETIDDVIIEKVTIILFKRHLGLDPHDTGRTIRTDIEVADNRAKQS